ncbi:MAG: tetratricopeptide repeat protein, partial [Chloroflexota bacterium]
MTKLSNFCNGVLEAGWLAALVLAPLFFNTYSARVFEPDKASLVRSIALIIAAAWLLKLIEEGGVRNSIVEFNPRRRWESLSRIPLLIPLAIYLTSYLLSSVLSLTPRTTFWGSYPRLQGAYTTLSYVVIFGAAVVNIRRKEQIERIITTIILTSLPISVYGIMQKFLLDPLPWGEDTITRITSTMGNAIFAGAYLIMIIPFTVMRTLGYYRAIIGEKEKLISNIAQGFIYTLILGAQLVALWFTGSRGPWLGLLAGMFFWIVLLSLVFKRRWIAVSALAIAVILGSFLIVFNIPNGPLESLRTTQGFGRLGRIFESQDGTSRVRELIWGGAVQMALPHEAAKFPDGRVDVFNFIRPLIGAGPESLLVTFSPFYSPELAHFEKQNAVPDRSHNETFDALLTTGAIGMIAYLTFFAAVIYFGLKWLGVIAAHDKRLYIALYVGGGILGATIMVMWRGGTYFGVGLPFGMLIGLFVYLTFITLRRTADEIDPQRALILASLIAAIVAHFTEIHFGIAIVATRLYFWMFVAMLIAVGWAMPKKVQQGEAATTPKAAAPESRRKRERGSHPEKMSRGSVGNFFMPAFPIFISGLILVTMSYDYFANIKQLTSVVDIIYASLFTLYGTAGTTSIGTALLFAFVWLAAALMWRDEQRAVWITLGGSGAVWLMFTILHANGLASVANFQPKTIQELAALLSMANTMLSRFVWWIIILMAMMAITLTPEWHSRYFRSGAQWIVAPLTFALAIVGSFFFNIMAIQADMSYKVAQPMDQQRRWDVAIPIYQQAIALAPEQDQYYLYLGRAYLESSTQTADRIQRETILNVALKELEKAQALNPLNPDHSANLGRLSYQWSRTTTDPTEAKIRIDNANTYFNNALALSPNAPTLWNEAARFDLAARKDSANALKKIERSISLDPKWVETYNTLGDIWTQLAAEEKDESKRRESYQKAISAYQQSIEAEKFRGVELARQISTRVSLGAAQKAVGNYDAAVATYQDILKIAGTSFNVWEVHRAMAETYLEKGDKTNALDYATKALAAAPSE